MFASSATLIFQSQWRHFIKSLVELGVISYHVEVSCIIALTIVREWLDFLYWISSLSNQAILLLQNGIKVNCIVSMLQEFILKKPQSKKSESSSLGDASLKKAMDDFKQVIVSMKGYKRVGNLRRWRTAFSQLFLEHVYLMFTDGRVL